VPVIGYRTDEMPSFYARSSGIPLASRAESAVEIAAAWRMHRALGRPQGMVVMQPVDAAHALSVAAVAKAVQAAQAAATKKRVTGAAATPFLLGEVDRITKGRARLANLALLEANAALAAEIAGALARMEGRTGG